MNKKVFQNRLFSTGSVFILLAAYFCSWWYDDVFLTSLIIVQLLLSLVQDIKGYIAWQLTAAGMTRSPGQHNQTYLNRFLSWRFYLVMLLVLLTPWLYNNVFVSTALLSILMLLLVQDIKRYFAKELATSNQTAGIQPNAAALSAKFFTWNSLFLLPVLLFASWVYDDVLIITVLSIMFISLIVQNLKGYIGQKLAQHSVSDEKIET